MHTYVVGSCPNAKYQSSGNMQYLTSPTNCGYFAINSFALCIRCSPTSVAFSCSLSSSMMHRTASAAAIDTAFPPN